MATARFLQASCPLTKKRRNRGAQIP
jgi:hypothetical protein